MRISPEAAFGASELMGEWESYRLARRCMFYPKTDTPLGDDLLKSLRESKIGMFDAWLVAEACRWSLGETPHFVRPLEVQGTFHRLFRVGLPGGGVVIVRINIVSGLGRDFTLLADRWAMDRVRSIGLPALRVLDVDLSRKVVPFDYEILEEARGESLRAYDHDESLIEPYLCELGRCLAQIHQIKLHGFGWIDIGPLLAPGGNNVGGIFQNWREYVLLKLAEHVQACLSCGTIDGKEARRIERAFEAADGLFEAVEPRLLHGDPGNHNIFVEKGEISTLLDWEDCLTGDPVFDIAFWGTFHPDSRLKAFLNGYRSAAALPHDFEWRYWLYYLRIALSKTVHRLRFGYTDRPGRPLASTRIQKALVQIESLARRADANSHPTVSNDFAAV